MCGGTGRRRDGDVHAVVPGVVRDRESNVAALDQIDAAPCPDAGRSLEDRVERRTRDIRAGVGVAGQVAGDERGYLTNDPPADP